MSPGIVRATEFALFVLALPMWIVVAKLYGLYERDEERTDHSTTDDFAGVFHMITVCTALFAFGLYLTQLAHPSAGKLATFWSAAIVLVASGRALARGYCRRHVRDVGQLVGKKMLKHPEYGLNLVGFVDDAPKERREDLEHLTLLGPLDRLPGLVRVFDIERVVIAFSHDSHERTLELVGPNFDMHSVEGIPLLGLPPPRLSHSSKLLKRTFGATASALAVVAAVTTSAMRNAPRRPRRSARSSMRRTSQPRRRTVAVRRRWSRIWSVRSSIAAFSSS